MNPNIALALFISICIWLGAIFLILRPLGLLP